LKKIKLLVSAFLIVAIISVGAINVNMELLAGSFYISKSDDLLCISEKNDTKSGETVPIGKNIIDSKDPKKDTRKNTTLKFKKTKVNDLKQVNTKGYKNIRVDSDLKNNPEVKKKLVEAFNDGTTIIFKKRDAKLKDLYDYFNVKYDSERVNKIDNPEPFKVDGIAIVDDKVKVVGTSIKKNENGKMSTVVYRAENYNDDNSLDRGIANEVKDFETPNLKLSSVPKRNILSLNNTAYAAFDPLSNGEWIPCDDEISHTVWNTFDISYTTSLYKRAGPSMNGYYYFLDHAIYVVKPIKSYTLGKMNFYKDNLSNGIISQCDPIDGSNTRSFNVTVGFPASLGLSFDVGETVDLSMIRGRGEKSCWWLFKPKYLLRFFPTYNKCQFEMVNVYKSKSSYFKSGNCYSVDAHYFSTGTTVTPVAANGSRGWYVDTIK
jgi:hypothetical protein